MRNLLNKRYSWLCLFLCLTLIRGLISAATIPPWQAPDETGRFEYAWLIARLGRVPTREDISATFEQELLASLYEWHYDEFTHRPLPEQMPVQKLDLPPQNFARRSPVRSGRFSLSYVWQALFLFPFRSQNLAFQLFVARLSSVLLNLGIIWLAWRTFKELAFCRTKLVVLMTAVMVFLPQHTFINSTVGDGTLAEAMACLVLYSWVCLFRGGSGMWKVLGIVLGTLIGMWSKVTAAFLIPVDIALALWWLLKQHRRAWAWRHTVYVCVGVAFVGLGLWAWSSSALGTRAFHSLQQLLDSTELIWVDERGITFGKALLLTYDSFWANFGWMALPVGKRWYGAVMAFSLLSVVGWMAKSPQETKTSFGALVIMILSFLMAVLIFVVEVLLLKPYYSFQGRYLFPVLVPYTFLLVNGLDKLFLLHQRWCIAVFLLLSLVCFDAWCFAGYILPYFYS
mgnify:CR=1 FL=1